MNSAMTIEEAYKHIKVGDRIVSNADNAYLTRKGIPYTGTVIFISGSHLHIRRDDGRKGSGINSLWEVHEKNSEAYIKLIKEDFKMDSSITSDVKDFIWKNRSVIYTVAILYLADSLLFDGKFKTKLSEIMENFLNKLSSKLDKKEE